MSNRTDGASSQLETLARMAPWMALPVLLGGAAIVWLRYGPPAVILWFCFALLAGAILLFWESLRTVIDPLAPGDEDTEGAEGNAVVGEQQERKRAALRALKDIEFEHSIRRLSDEDYAALQTRYRAEARAAMEAIDRGLGPYLSRAEELIARAEGGASPEELAAESSLDGDKGPRKNRKKKQGATATESVGVVEATKTPDEIAKPDESAAKSDARTCASCETRNDADATFCKKCGARL